MIASLNVPTDSRRVKRDRSAELFTRTSFGRFEFDACSGYSCLATRLRIFVEDEPSVAFAIGDSLAAICMLTPRGVCSLARTWRSLHRNRFVL